MRILMLPTQTLAVMDWRFRLPAEALSAAGHEVTLFTGDDYSRIIKDRNGLGPWLKANAANFDVIHTGYSPVEEHMRILAWVRQEFGTPIVTDIDDDFRNVPPYNEGYNTYNRASLGYRTTRLQLRISDGVTTTTPALAASCAEETKAPIGVFPNLISAAEWQFPTDPTRALDKSIRVLLAGGKSRNADWQLIREALKTLMGKYDGKGGRPRMRLLFFGATPDWAGKWLTDRLDPTNNQAFYLRPTLETKTLDLYRRILCWVAPDISLAPITPNAFNAAKSNIKALEAGMCGAAFVCTDWPTYGDVPKEACLKADNTITQWVESVSALIEDSPLLAVKKAKLASWARTQTADSGVKARIAFYQQIIDTPHVNLAKVAAEAPRT